VLSLPLFVFRVGANDPHHALAVDQLAFVANLFNRCPDFHTLSDLFQNPSPRKIVLPELDFHVVARQEPDPIPYRRSRSMRQNLRFVTQLKPVKQARQLFHHNRLNRIHRVHAA
jgi:hypothetical protein